MMFDFFECAFRCEATRWTSGSSVSCRMAPGVERSRGVSVTIAQAVLLPTSLWEVLSLGHLHTLCVRPWTNCSRSLTRRTRPAKHLG